MVPSFYDPSRCGTLVKPDLAMAAREGAKAAASGIKPTQKRGGSDPFVVLVIIDNQVDFTSPQGNLFVPGSVEDLDRLNRFIYANVGQISHILASLDTHFLYQPFFAHNWIAGSNPARKQDGTYYVEGDIPDPFTIITLEDVRHNTWLPTRMPNRMQEMLRQLENSRKKSLCIWPLHCILGTPGHALDPTLAETIFYHATARNNQYSILDKGKSPCSEHYGIWQAEVEFPDDPTTAVRMDMINQWIDADVILFAGQAKSHCVLETLNQTVDMLVQRSPDLLKKMRVLEDCMSNVPDIVDDAGNVIVPFKKMTDDRFDELKQMGVQFIKSTDSLIL